MGQARPRLLPARVRFESSDVDRTGWLSKVDPDRAELELVDAPQPGPEVGEGTTVFVESERNLVLVGVVAAVEGSRVRLDLGHAGHREDRWSPRERGRLRFRFQPRPPGVDGFAWAEGAVSPPGAFTEVDGEVELSLTGLAFETDPVPEGVLLMALALPSHPEREHRLLARVLREDPSPAPGLYRVVVVFTHVPEATGSALAELLQSLQDQALAAFGADPDAELPPLG